MTITYSTKAKQDLIQMDWRLRHRIINILGKIKNEKKYSLFKRMYNSEFYKINFPNHLLICQLDNDEFNILTVVEKKKLRFPE